MIGLLSILDGGLRIFFRVGNQALAIDYINRALDHTPTLNDLYMVKAKIEKVTPNGKLQKLIIFSIEATYLKQLVLWKKLNFWIQRIGGIS